MTQEIKRFIVRAVENARGDDLYRAEHAFAGQNLSKLYGESGKTKQQILDEYRAHDALANAAIAEINKL